MWDYLSIILVTTGLVCLYDTIFNVKDKFTQTTSFEKIQELYIGIKSLKNDTLIPTPSPTINFVRLHSLTTIEVVKTIVKMKYQILVNYYYTPEKLGDEFLILPYYFKGTCWKAIIPHSFSSTGIFRITTIEGEDVTTKIAPFLGPNIDFYGCKITPKHFGYTNLIFHSLVDSNVQRFEENDILNLKTLQYSSSLEDIYRVK